MKTLVVDINRKELVSGSERVGSLIFMVIQQSGCPTGGLRLLMSHNRHHRLIE